MPLGGRSMNRSVLCLAGTVLAAWCETRRCVHPRQSWGLTAINVSHVRCGQLARAKCHPIVTRLCPIGCCHTGLVERGSTAKHPVLFGLFDG